MVAKINNEALWIEVARATAVRPHAPRTERHAPETRAPNASSDSDPARPAAPESEAWAALLAHSESTVNRLGDLSESIRAFSAARTGGTAVPGGMTVEDGQVLNSAGHAPRGLNKPTRSAAQAQESGSGAPVTGTMGTTGTTGTMGTTGTDSPTPAAPSSVASGLAHPAPDFPWPGWPRAPQPRSEHRGHPWRPPAVPTAQGTEPPAA